MRSNPVQHRCVSTPGSLRSTSTASSSPMPGRSVSQSSPRPSDRVQRPNGRDHLRRRLLQRRRERRSAPRRTRSDGDRLLRGGSSRSAKRLAERPRRRLREQRRRCLGAACPRGVGVEIGSHGMTHAPLVTGAAADLRREIVDSRAALETMLETRVESFAYPYGATPSASARRLVEQTYTAACTTRAAVVGRTVDPHAVDLYALPRIDAHYARRPRMLRAFLAARSGTTCPLVASAQARDARSGTTSWSDVHRESPRRRRVLGRARSGIRPTLRRGRIQCVRASCASRGNSCSGRRRPWGRSRCRNGRRENVCRARTSGLDDLGR